MSNLSHASLYGYQVEQELGHNCVGGRVTYLATDTTTQQPVVIKQFQFAQSGSSWLGYQAYEQELKMLQKLHHPSIPCYLNSFETPAGFGLVQEYKKAPSLAQPRHFTPLEIKQIAVSVLEVLVYLQQQTPPIIHRDIKPENILVDRSTGQIKVYLVDFGLARMGGEEVATSSAVKGTLGFMPPEQLFNRQLTEASDLYSLGVTLICLLTKTKSTAVGNLIDEAYRINFKPLLPKLNRRFIDWLEKMVAPSLKKRYPNAANALEALKPIPVFSSQNQRSVAVVGGLTASAVLLLGLGKTLSDKYLESPTSLYYTVTDLGTLPGGICSSVSDINEAGQVVGDSVIGNRKQHLFLWNNGNITDLSTVDDNVSSASSINNKGQVVGWSLPTLSNVAHAFLWENHTKTDLGTLGGVSADAADINDVGEVVGEAATSIRSRFYHAILWNILNNTKTDLGTLGGDYSAASRINNVGQVVGISTYTTSNGKFHAFFWENGQMIDLSTLGGNESRANGINNTGQVIGSSETSSGSNHAVLWHNGTKTDLGTLSGDNGSNAQDINDKGTIVGWSSNTNNSNSFGSRAVVWKKGTISDLNNLIPPNSGWELSAAKAINNRGQIVGNGRHNGAIRAFLLTPAKKP